MWHHGEWKSEKQKIREDKKCRQTFEKLGIERKGGKQRKELQE